MSSTLAPYHIPHSVMEPVLGSIGGALGVAGQVGGSRADPASPARRDSQSGRLGITLRD